jgi:hypothetical protein
MVSPKNGKDPRAQYQLSLTRPGIVSRTSFRLYSAGMSAKISEKFQNAYQAAGGDPSRGCRAPLEKM